MLAKSQGLAGMWTLVGMLGMLTMLWVLLSKKEKSAKVTMKSKK